MEIGTELVLAQNNALSVAQNQPNFCQLSMPVSSAQSKAVIRSGRLSVEVNDDIPDDFLYRIIKAMNNV
jgi:hypothetical protein